MTSTTGAEPISIVGITACILTAILEFLDVNSGAIVALGSIIGAICAIIGCYRSIKKDKDNDWVDEIVREKKSRKWFKRKDK